MAAKPLGSGPEVGHCQTCGVTIRQDHPYTWCAACGEPLPEALRDRLSIPKPVPPPGASPPAVGPPPVQSQGPTWAMVRTRPRVLALGAMLGALWGFAPLIAAVLAFSLGIGPAGSRLATNLVRLAVVIVAFNAYFQARRAHTLF